MSLRVCLFERSPARLAPFTDLRPTWGLRAGRHTLAERVARITGDEPALVAGRAHVVALERGDRAAAPREVPCGDTLFLDGALVLTPALWHALLSQDEPFRLLAGDEIVAARLPEGEMLPGGLALAEALADRAETVRTLAPVAGAGEGASRHPIVIRGATDLVAHLDRLIPADALLGALVPLAPESAPGVNVLGEHPVHVGAGVRIDPGSTLDAREGPIALDDDVVVTGHAWLAGPASIGPGTTLLGGAIGPYVGVGPRCKLRGELAESIVHGYSNKAHDGFIGHSVLGEWVNLGAMTTCSDLKNSYGEVRLEIDGAAVSTGLTKLGTLAGDHVKTAIGTLLGTGTIVGTGANVFGEAGLTPRSIAPFAWGTRGVACSTDWSRFVATARRVMSRRGVAMTPAYEDALRAAYEARAASDRPAQAGS